MTECRASAATRRPLWVPSTIRSPVALATRSARSSRGRAHPDTADVGLKAVRSRSVARRNRGRRDAHDATAPERGVWPGTPRFRPPPDRRHTNHEVASMARTTSAPSKASVVPGPGRLRRMMGGQAARAMFGWAIKRAKRIGACARGTSCHRPTVNSVRSPPASQMSHEMARAPAMATRTIRSEAGTETDERRLGARAPRPPPARRAGTERLTARPGACREVI